MASSHFEQHFRALQTEVHFFTLFKTLVRSLMQHDTPGCYFVSVYVFLILFSFKMGCDIKKCTYTKKITITVTVTKGFLVNTLVVDSSQ